MRFSRCAPLGTAVEGHSAPSHAMQSSTGRKKGQPFRPECNASVTVSECVFILRTFFRVSRTFWANKFQFCNYHGVYVNYFDYFAGWRRRPPSLRTRPQTGVAIRSPYADPPAPYTLSINPRAVLRRIFPLAILLVIWYPFLRIIQQWIIHIMLMRRTRRHFHERKDLYRAPDHDPRL